MSILYKVDTISRLFGYQYQRELKQDNYRPWITNQFRNLTNRRQVSFRNQDMPLYRELQKNEHRLSKYSKYLEEIL